MRCDLPECDAGDYFEGVGVGVGVGDEVDDAACTAEPTNCRNALASLSEPVYCLPLTITVGVPVSFAIVEFGSGFVSTRFVADDTQSLNV